ncbi:hypothetical protein ACUIJQ_12260 [Levilactobacillus hammesii]|nr:hypothetical protein [Levilactobacillus hammesii]
MLRQIEAVVCGLLMVASMGAALLTGSALQTQAAHKLSKVPVSIKGNWFIDHDHMGKFNHGKVVTMHFTSKYADTHLWNSQRLTLKQDKARHRLSKKAVKLVTRQPKPSQFMLEHVGKSQWNRYSITRSKNGQTKYITDHYWVHAPVIGGIRVNDHLYTWRTTASHRFNTQPLRGKHAIVSWKMLKSQGTWYIKTP